MTPYLGWIGLALGAAASGAVLASGPGTRLGLWNFRFGFSLLRLAFFVGLPAAAVSLAALLWPSQGNRQAKSAGWAGLALGLAAWTIPWGLLRSAKGFPPIHDITTDTENPPSFSAIVPLRANAPNKLEYGGPELARTQRAAYPDIAPLKLKDAPAAVFPRALAAARGMGWEIVAADADAGRIEATATTLWFGFKDDVAIRVASDGADSRVDIRSISRVGKGDVGANAKRIRAFLQAMSSL